MDNFKDYHSSRALFHVESNHISLAQSQLIVILVIFVITNDFVNDLLDDNVVLLLVGWLLFNYFRRAHGTMVLNKQPLQQTTRLHLMCKTK